MLGGMGVEAVEKGGTEAEGVMEARAEVMKGGVVAARVLEGEEMARVVAVTAQEEAGMGLEEAETAQGAVKAA